MAKANDTNYTPGTMSGRVIARLDEIEGWFRAGFKTKEVLERLSKEGIRLHRVKFTQLLSRYGKSESAVRRALAAEGFVQVPDQTPATRTTRPVEQSPPVAKEPSVRAASSPNNKTPKTAGKTEKRVEATEALKAKIQKRVEFRPDPNPNKADVV